MLFLRTTPLFPNVGVNVGAPIVGIPIHVFAIGTFIGLMPANIIHIRTGMEVANFDPKKDITKLVLFLLLLSAVVLIPTYFTEKIEIVEDEVKK